MTFLVLVLAIVAALIAGVVFAIFLRRAKSQALRAEKERDIARFALAQMIVPLVWMERADLASPQGQRLHRSALLQVFGMAQAGLGETDAEMGERVEVVAEPPRRLPKYPIIPPWIASPQDVASRGMGSPESIVRIDAPQADQ